MKMKFEINIEIDDKDFTLYELDEDNSLTDKITSTSEETKINLKEQIKNSLKYQLDYLFKEEAIYEMIDNDSDLPVFEKDEVKYTVELKT